MSNKDKKEFKIINGKGKIKFSPVEKHLEVEKPKNSPSKDKIIIPSEKN